MNAKQLKDSILQYAMQGKLVSQNPNDEPASELLQRITDEKEKLIKAGVIKKEKPVTPILDEEILYDIPSSWEWVRLKNLGYITSGGTPKTTEQSYWTNGEIVWITPSDMGKNKSKFLSESARKITKAGLSNSSAQLIPKHSIVYSSRAPIGHINIMECDYSTNQGCKSVTPLIIDVTFLYYALIYMTPEIRKKASGTTFKEISGTVFSETLIPLPPLNEQVQIVKKIEQLLVKVKEYEVEYSNVTKLNAKFPKDLEKSILQYAMQGKLVEQDLNDKPAQRLIEKIQLEKERLIKEKVIKKEKPLPQITEEEIPFDIPSSWVWVRLNDISVYIQRGKSPKYSTVEEIPVISQKCIQWSGFNIEPAKFIEPSTLEKYDEIRLLKTNDILWNSTGLGTIGRVGIYDSKFNPYDIAVADSHVTVVRTSELVDTEFIYYYLASPTIQDSIEDIASGSTKQKELNTSTIKEILIPLPPYEEQKRIVKKINELLSVSRKLIK